MGCLGLMQQEKKKQKERNICLWDAEKPRKREGKCVIKFETVCRAVRTIPSQIDFSPRCLVVFFPFFFSTLHLWMEERVEESIFSGLRLARRRQELPGKYFRCFDRKTCFNCNLLLFVADGGFKIFRDNAWVMSPLILIKIKLTKKLLTVLNLKFATLVCIH